MDVMDIYTSTDGEIRDTMPPYVGGGHRGRPMNLSYTEEVAGSSPVPPTKSLDRPIERILYSLRYEHRGELDELGLEKGSFDGKTSYNSIKPTGGMSPLRNTRFCPKDSDNMHTIEI